MMSYKDENNSHSHKLFDIMIEWKLYYEEHVPNHYNKAVKLNAWTEVSKKDM